MQRVFIILGIFCFFISCNSNVTKPQTPDPAPQPTVPPPPKPVVKGEQLYPSIKFEVIKDLWDNCTGIDYTFHYMNFSMNRTEQNDIRNSITHIAEQPALIRSDCKSIGRIFFQTNEGIKLECEIFFSKNCTYFVFMDGNTPIAANYMTDNGIKFFTSIFTRMKVPIKE